MQKTVVILIRFCMKMQQIKSIVTSFSSLPPVRIPNIHYFQPSGQLFLFRELTADVFQTHHVP